MMANHSTTEIDMPLEVSSGRVYFTNKLQRNLRNISHNGPRELFHFNS